MAYMVDERDEVAEPAHGAPHLRHVASAVTGGGGRRLLLRRRRRRRGVAGGGDDDGLGEQRVGERLLQLVHALRQRVLEVARLLLEPLHVGGLPLRHRLQLRREHPDHLGGAEPGDPEEEPLGAGAPHAGHHEEHVAPRRLTLRREQPVVVRQRRLHHRPELRPLRRRLQRRPQLRRLPPLLLHPLRVLHLERHHT
ncbi:hypothetical protein EE612_042439 [Oryza sativa]|nr:hypothetical protein EE612_042439 [Oryza sativa]